MLHPCVLDLCALYLAVHTLWCRASFLKVLLWLGCRSVVTATICVRWLELRSRIEVGMWPAGPYGMQSYSVSMGCAVD